MEDLFSTLLTLIPLALFVGIRLVAARRKKTAAGDTAKLASAIRAVSAQVYDEDPRPLRSFVAESAEFSAHALRVEDEPRLAGTAPRGKQQRRKNQPVPLEAAAAEASPLAPAAAFGYAATARPATAGDSAVSALARVERLPTLKRAVVYAELLGDPKGL